MPGENRRSVNNSISLWPTHHNESSGFCYDLPVESPGWQSLMHNDCPLVLIRWQDSTQPLSSWQFLSALPRTRPLECATVGWLLKDDEEVKVICQSVGDIENPKNAQASGIMTIPTRCVLSMEKLTEEDVPISSSASAGNRRPADAAADLEIGSAMMQQEFAPHPA